MARATGKSGGVTVFRHLSRLYDTILSRADVEIEAADAPDLQDVLQEIDQLLRS